VSSHEWLYFIKQIEEAGADAVELNIYYFPADFSVSSKTMEKSYLKIIEKAKESATIPVTVKMSPYFTNLGRMIDKVSRLDVDGITLFNRFYKPDIDIETKELVVASVFSSPKEYVIPLQWVALMSNHVDVNMAASTGIHDGESFVKLLLAGASANYIVSSLYKNGFEVIETILAYLENYLKENNFESVFEIIGLLSQNQMSNQKHYQRAQFMKYFSDAIDIV